MVFPQLSLSRTILRAISPNFIPSKVKFTRGTFDPVKLYQLAFVWNPYQDDGKTKLDAAAVRYYYSKYRYQELGLFYEDCVNEEIPVVVEAVSRLPKEVREARQFRIDRAIMSLTSKKALPKELHTTHLQDIPYLSPYIYWVENEAAEYDAFIAEQEDVAIPPGRTAQLADYDIHSGTRRITKMRFNDAHDAGYKISKSTSGYWWH